MTGRSWIVLAVFAAACTSTPPAPGVDGGGSGMGSGVSVAWRSTPAALPVSLAPDQTLDSVTFAVGSLDVVGTAGPGDPRTTVQNVTLTWNQDGAPPTTTFVDAPSGPYSSIALTLDGHLANATLEVHGTYMGLPCEVEDRAQVSVSLPLQRTLDAGGSLAIGVKIDFADALSAIDWSKADMDDGHYEVHGGPMLQSFLAKLTQDIQIDDTVQ
jgi:hypothetical protein